MAELWAAFHDAWEVLAFRTSVAILVVEANAGTATRLAVITPRAVLAKAGTITLLALVAPRAVLTKSGTIACPALVASRVMLTEAGAAAIPALVVTSCLVGTSCGCAAGLGAVPGVQAVLPELLGPPDPWCGGSEYLSRIVAGRLLMEAGTISGGPLDALIEYRLAPRTSRTSHLSHLAPLAPRTPHETAEK